MWPHAKVRVDAIGRAPARRIALGHGDLIGRMSSAVLTIDDARVSEAHAMVSLRGGVLYLLALRRRVIVGGELRSEISLTPGLRVEFALGLGFDVQHLVLAGSVLGLRVGDLPPAPLLGVCSFVDTSPGFVAGYRADAEGYLFNTDDDWRLQLRGQVARPLGPGESFALGGREFTIVNMPLAGAGAQRTAPDTAQGALEIQCYPKRTHLLRSGGEDELRLAGVAAKIMFELGAVRGLVNWYAAAKRIWPGSLDEGALRPRWDMGLSRLRAKLRAAGIRTTLVRTDGAGNVELFLLPGDELKRDGDQVGVET